MHAAMRKRLGAGVAQPPALKSYNVKLLTRVSLVLVCKRLRHDITAVGPK